MCASPSGGLAWRSCSRGWLKGGSPKDVHITDPRLRDCVTSRGLKVFVRLRTWKWGVVGDGPGGPSVLPGETMCPCSWLGRAGRVQEPRPPDTRGGERSAPPRSLWPEPAAHTPLSAPRGLLCLTEGTCSCCFPPVGLWSPPAGATGDPDSPSCSLSLDRRKEPKGSPGECRSDHGSVPWSHGLGRGVGPSRGSGRLKLWAAPSHVTLL